MRDERLQSTSTRRCSRMRVFGQSSGSPITNGMLAPKTGVRCRIKLTVVNRWDEKAGLRRDAVRSQVIDALEAQEIKETGNEED
jgi:hypothetical protein